jgi:hypothetical protein
VLVRKRGKMGFNHFFIYKTPLSPTLTAIFYFSFFNSVAKKIAWVEKILVRRNLPPQIMPMQQTVMDLIYENI